MALLDRVVNLLEEGHDVAVRIGPLADSSLRAVKVGEVRRLYCTAPEYLQRHGHPKTLSDLKKHRQIGGRAAQLVVNTNQADRDAAPAGWGIVRLLSYQVAEPIKMAGCKRCLPTIRQNPGPFTFCLQAARQLGPYLVRKSSIL